MSGRCRFCNRFAANRQRKFDSLRRRGGKDYVSRFCNVVLSDIDGVGDRLFAIFRRDFRFKRGDFIAAAVHDDTVGINSERVGVGNACKAFNRYGRCLEAIAFGNFVSSAVDCPSAVCACAGKGQRIDAKGRGSRCAAAGARQSRALEFNFVFATIGRLNLY